MKKIVFILLALVTLLTGCGGNPENTGPEPEAEQEAGQPAAEPVESNIPGTWTVPEGWVRADAYSTEDKIFYVEEGHEEDELPDNISIEVGTNRYSAEEHEQFRDAIVRQYSMQLSGMDATLTGDGSFTEQDYVLYTFTITEEDVVTTQLYIVGDQRYCLVHLTNFTGAEGAAEAARAIADSFVWNE